MPVVCVDLSANTQIIAHLSEAETLAASFALEFGSKCGIFSSVDALTDAASEFLEPLENAMKEVTDSISAVIGALNDVLSQFQYLTNEAIALIDSFMTSAMSALNTAITAIDGLVDDIAAEVASATNALSSALCNTLNSAITGLPSNVVLNTPGLLAVTTLDKNNPADFLKNAMGEAVGNLKFDILNEVSDLQLALVDAIPDLTSYVCTPP